MSGVRTHCHLRQFTLAVGMEELNARPFVAVSEYGIDFRWKFTNLYLDWVLEVLASRGMIDGKTLGVDATTLEANAALRSIVRRDTGESYESYGCNSHTDTDHCQLRIGTTLSRVVTSAL